ncbi:MAG: metallophosphoesterase [Pelosinus sp.]|nr:metallophosphoesterase [Pelosinus sp.]
MHGPSISLYVIALIVGAICWGVYYLLKKMLPIFQQKALGYAYILLTVGVVVLAFFNRTLSAAGMPQILSMVGVWWMMGLFFMLPLLLFWRGLAIVEQRTSKKAGGISRRDFICKGAAVLPVVSLGLSAKGVYDAREITVQRHNFRLPNFPKDLGKVKIVQISDTHIGPFFGPKSLERALNLAASEQPDLVVITGDLIDDLSLLDSTMKTLADFQKTLPYGLYFTWGNHEYFRDQNKIRRALAESPLTVLENSSCQIIQGERPFYLIGVDYPWAKSAEEMRSVKQNFLQQAVEKVPDNAFKVLLSHHPDFIDNAFAAGLPLTLSGHTHGGQVNVFGHSLLPVKYKYMRGLYQQGDLVGYVSTGTGSWLPFRLGCPAEISVFTLSALS